MSVCDPGVEALLVGTGEALGVDPLGRSSPTFHLAPGAYRRRGRAHTRREVAAEATSGAIKWSAWPQKALDRGAHGLCFCLRRRMMGPVQMTQLCQEEHEEGQKQEHKHMKHHKDPRCLK